MIFVTFVLEDEDQPGLWREVLHADVAFVPRIEEAVAIPTGASSWGVAIPRSSWTNYRVLDVIHKFTNLISVVHHDVTVKLGRFS